MSSPSDASDSSLDRVARAWRLTPAGRGAVASIRLAGPQSGEIAQRLFQGISGGAALAELPSDRMVLGRWQLAGEACEEVVLRRIDPVTIEIHCHGGEASVASVLDSLRAAGAKIESASELPAASVDLELRLALADARTERTAAILLDQLHGAFNREMDKIARDLEEPANRPSAIARLRQLRDLIPFGRHLTIPWQVVLAGLPNVGKSSLINALVGYRRAIVHATPGTTRDVVSSVTAFEGWPVELSDTAGQRTSQDPIESAGVEQARRRAAHADLVVLVVDGSAPPTPDEAALRATWAGALVVANKGDLPAGRALDGVDLRVSAVTGEGMTELVAVIARRLAPAVPPPGAAVPVIASHGRQIAELLS